MDIRNKLVGAMSILLTLFRSNVCWAKPNHAFFYCQHSFAIFFLPTITARHVHASESPRARTYLPNREARSPNSVFKKALLFRCFFYVVRLSACLGAWTAWQLSLCNGIACRLSAS
ncbi:hypothetical protein [Xanthomonas axonopodis]|uniref:hypothetical protein n=1 Tax=Xanthomonas axonopodis TaxID=53413 RepID=UPI001072A711|nr:hypothetical protein [Xanthomonas axonopodis]